MNFRTFLLLLKQWRVESWYKQWQVFIPLVFAFSAENAILLSGVAVIMCLASGIVYSINDVIDLNYDSKHNTKSKRPLAAGNLTLSQVTIGIIGLVVAILFLLLLYKNVFLLLVVILFVLMNIFYAKVAKKLPYFEVLFYGIVLQSFRFLAGYAVFPIIDSLSVLLVLAASGIFMLSFLRYIEKVLYGDESRAILKKYSLRSLSNFSILALLLFAASHVLLRAEVSALFVIIVGGRMYSVLLDETIDKVQKDDWFKLFFVDVRLRVLGFLYVTTIFLYIARFLLQ